MPLHRGLAAGVLTFLTIASVIVAQAPAAAQEDNAPEAVGSVGIRLLEAPVSLQDDPRAMAYIIDNLPPGATITRRIEVRNGSDREQNIALYPAAASIGEEGDGFQVGDDRAVNELTTWMSVVPTDVVLPPYATEEALVTIAVPEDAPEGEQYAVVWAQTADAPDGTGIQNVGRAGIRTYLSVGPGNGPPADLAIDEVTAERSQDGAPRVIASITNTGGRALDPGGTLALTDGPGGISTQPTPGSGGTIAPGGTGEVVFELDPATPPGPWQASVSVTSGLVNKSTTVDLSFPEEGSRAATSNETGGVRPWVWILAVVIAIAAIAGGVLALRNRKAP